MCAGSAIARKLAALTLALAACSSRLSVEADEDAGSDGTDLSDRRTSRPVPAADGQAGSPDAGPPVIGPRDGAAADSSRPDMGVAGADAGPPSAVPDAGSAVLPVFDVTVLHEIRLEVATQDLAALEKGGGAYVPCRVTFDGFELPMSGIRRKGLTTRSVPLSGKPSFSVKFDAFVPDRNLYGLHKIVLNSGYHDPGFVNEHIGYTALGWAGLPSALSAHGVVTFNGVVKGFYVVKEAITKQFLARVFGRTNREGNLYEGSVGMGYTGDFVLDPLKIELKDEVEEMRKRDDVIALAAAVRPGTTDNRTDDQFTRDVSAKMRFSEALSTYAVNAILSSWDSYWWGSNNYYLFDNPADSKFVIISHGMDRLFAKLGTFGAGPPLPTMCPLASADNYNGGMPGELAKRIRRRPTLDKQFVAEVSRLIRVVWDVPKLNAVLSRVGTTLHSTKRTDAAVVRDLAAFDNNAAVLRDFFGKRKAFLDMVAATGACPATM